MEDKKLFSHIYFLKEQTANRIPWGRGNGWVFLSLSDLLYTLHRHVCHRFVLRGFKRHSGRRVPGGGEESHEGFGEKACGS